MQRKKLTDLKQGDRFVHFEWTGESVVEFKMFSRDSIWTHILVTLYDEDSEDYIDTVFADPRDLENIELDVLDPEEEYEIVDGKVVILSADEDM